MLRTCRLPRKLVYVCPKSTCAHHDRTRSEDIQQAVFGFHSTSQANGSSEQDFLVFYPPQIDRT
ncbi:hypothetical protein EJB05_09525 [Eragrostis curvula]|uniref:BIRD-IDD transcription factor second C2H2 zinc finger domain-containing protein n=1 Tax=Eragrostis curvula TaxID=38414 RepID=A0A5J9W4N6_9POAL|nr:hypothetical protein EJB05_09525 [Eragrostis curvula]